MSFKWYLIGHIPMTTLRMKISLRMHKIGRKSFRGKTRELTQFKAMSMDEQVELIEQKGKVSCMGTK
jgi:hypothetical protein